VKKGPKRFIVANNNNKTQKTFPKRISKDNINYDEKDGADININDNEYMDETSSRKKRKIHEIDEDDVEDDQIDREKWVIN